MVRFLFVRRTVVAFSLVLIAGCAGAGSLGGAGNAPVSMAPTTGLAASRKPAALFGSAPASPHIYGIAYPRATNAPYAIKKFTEQGALVATSGTFANLTLPSALTYDAHNQTLYVLNGNGVVTAYDAEGNSKKLAGTFPNTTAFPTDIVFDAHNNLLYILDEKAFESSPRITAYDEQGFIAKVPGGFPNLGNHCYALAYDSHNGLLYYGGLNVNNNVYTPFVSVFDEQGNAQTTAGSFSLSGDPQGIAFDTHDGFVYISEGDSQSQFFSVVAYDEQGNRQALSPGFPKYIPAIGDVKYDANNGLFYVSVGEFVGRKYELTIQGWDELGNRQSLAGHFDFPRTAIHRLTVGQ